MVYGNYFGIEGEDNIYDRFYSDIREASKLPEDDQKSKLAQAILIFSDKILKKTLKSTGEYKIK